MDNDKDRYPGDPTRSGDDEDSDWNKVGVVGSKAFARMFRRSGTSRTAMTSVTTPIMTLTATAPPTRTARPHEAHTRQRWRRRR